MVEPQLVRVRLEAIERYLTKLEPMRRLPEERFLADEAAHDLAEHYLHLAVEAVADIGNHLVADRGLPAPDTQAGVFDALAREKVLDRQLCDRLKRWVGFRNVLVHEYLAIDHRVTFHALQEELDDFRSFAQAVASLL